MRQHVLAFYQQILIALMINSVSINIVCGGDAYPESTIDGGQIDDDLRNRHPFLVPLKEWFLKISNPTFKCIQPDPPRREHMKGWLL